MEFDSDWLTLGRHRVRLRCARGFPTEKTRTVAELARIAIENNLSAAARLVEVAATGPGENAYTITVGTTFAKDREAATNLELALATMLGIRADHLNMEVQVISQAEVDTHFGVYERCLAEKLGIVLPIQ